MCKPDNDDTPRPALDAPRALPPPLPFEAELSPVFQGFVRVASAAAKAAQPGHKDITYQRVLEAMIRSWRDETRFMRRINAIRPRPLAPLPDQPRESN